MFTLLQWKRGILLVKLWEGRLSYASPKSSICIVLESGYIWQAFFLFSHGFGTCQSTEAEWTSCSNLNWANRCGFAFCYVLSLRLPWKYLWVISTPKLHSFHVNILQLYYKNTFFALHLIMLPQMIWVLQIIITEFIWIHFISNNHPWLWVFTCIISILGPTNQQREMVISQDYL